MHPPPGLPSRAQSGAAIPTGCASDRSRFVLSKERQCRVALLESPLVPVCVLVAKKMFAQNPVTKVFGRKKQNRTRYFCLVFPH